MRFVALEPGKVSAKTKVISIPAQTDYAEYITGQVFADKEGTLSVEETYNLPVFPGTLINEFAGIVVPQKTEAQPVERFNQTDISFTPEPQYEEAEDEVEAEKKEQKEKEEKLIEEWMALATWSLCVLPEVPEKTKEPEQPKAQYKVAAKEALSFSTYAGGPFWRITFESASETKEVKIFARAFERGKV